MSKLYLIISTILILISLLFGLYKKGEYNGRMIEAKKQQKIDLEIKDSIIRSKKEVEKRRQFNESKPTIIIKNEKIDLLNIDSNLGWLHQRRCKNCRG